MLIGNLGADAETRFTTNNISVTTFPLATSRNIKDPNNGWVSETTWHRIVCFNLPDYYKEILKKGKKFYVEGRIQIRHYNEKDTNKKRYYTEIIAEQIIPLDTKFQITEETNENIKFGKGDFNNIGINENKEDSDQLSEAIESNIGDYVDNILIEDNKISKGTDQLEKPNIENGENDNFNNENVFKQKNIKKDLENIDDDLPF